MHPLLTQYFRCPSSLADFAFEGNSAAKPGFFRYGSDAICYGRLSAGHVCERPDEPLFDVSDRVKVGRSGVEVPFDPEEIVKNLRQERYVAGHGQSAQTEGVIREVYYLLRPFFPLSVRKHLQRIYLRGWDRLPFPTWPVDTTVDKLLRSFLAMALRASGMESIPFIWFWPNGASGCAIMTHDVEAEVGKRFCSNLMTLNESFGIPASFQIVPEERYSVDSGFLAEIKERGFEVNIHDLNHDCKLFQDRQEFERRVKLINRYGAEYGAVGFRSAALYRNPEWFSSLDFEYDMSIPNVAHLDPQRGGCCTVMPYFIDQMLELPLTATQDHSLFNILNDFTMDLWKRQTNSILQENGLMSFIVHPDYLIEKRNQEAYKKLLGLICGLRAEKNVWVALPKEVNRWWRMRDKMRLRQNGKSWIVEGEGSDQARIALASLHGDRVAYSLVDEPTKPMSSVANVSSTEQAS